jgi:hypothetical protein
VIRRSPISRRSRPRKRAKRKASMRTCDKLFSQLIRTRDDWTCRACGSAQSIQCAHLVSRRYHGTRWEPDNAVALCARDHMRWTYDPLGWEAWCDERWPGRLAALKHRALRAHAKADYPALAEELSARLKGLEVRRGSA